MVPYHGVELNIKNIFSYQGFKSMLWPRGPLARTDIDGAGRGQPRQHQLDYPSEV